MKYGLECLKCVLQMDMLKTEFNNHSVQTLKKREQKRARIHPMSFAAPHL